MRNIIIIAATLLSACNYKQPSDCTTQYKIEVMNINYSMGYTTVYHINNDSLSIEFVDGIERSNDSIWLKQSLTETQRTDICKYLSSFDPDTLKSEYIQRGIEDGDQKVVTLQIGGKNKTINISNYYQKDMDGLFDVVNNVIKDKRYKIRYEKLKNKE